MKSFSMQSVTGFHVYNGHSIPTTDLTAFSPEWSNKYPAPHSNESQRELTSKVLERFKIENPTLTILKVSFSCGEWWIEADKNPLSLHERIEEMTLSFKEKQDKITNNVSPLSEYFEGKRFFNDNLKKGLEVFVTNSAKLLSFDEFGEGCSDNFLSYYDTWDCYQKEGNTWVYVGCIRKFSHSK